MFIPRMWASEYYRESPSILSSKESAKFWFRKSIYIIYHSAIHVILSQWHVLNWPAAGAELKEVEEDHEREEDGGPGDVDQTSDGGDWDSISLTLHRGEFYYISHLFLFMTSTTDWSVNFRISNGTKTLMNPNFAFLSRRLYVDVIARFSFWLN